MSNLVIRNTVDPQAEYFLEGLFNDLFNIVQKKRDSGAVATLEKESYPKCDISETKDQVFIEATVPGLTKDDITVEYHEGTLSISGEIKRPVEGRSFVYKGIRHSKFIKKFFLSEDYVDPTSVVPEVKNGILYITIDKTEKAKPKEPVKITVL